MGKFPPYTFPELSKSLKMSGRGGKKRQKSMTRSAKAGVLFPVGRIDRYLRRDTHHYRIGSGAPIYMAAVIEYLTGGSILSNNYTESLRHVQGRFENHTMCIGDAPGLQGGPIPGRRGAVPPREEGPLSPASWSPCTRSPWGLDGESGATCPSHLSQ